MEAFTSFEIDFRGNTREMDIASAFASRFAIRLLVVIAGGLSLANCAKIRVQPADPNSTERDGVVIYPQRPYLVVKEEFPVEGDEGYLVGTFTQGFVTIRANELLAARFGEKDIRVPASAIRVSVSADEGGGGRGELKSDEGEEKGEEPPEQEESSETDEKKTVYTKATGSLSWDPTVPSQEDISDLFKIVYLPDLDEKRVVGASAGIGTVDYSVALGPGGVVNRFQATIDNSALGEFLIDTAKDVIEIAKKAAKLAAKAALLSALEEEGKILKEGQQILIKYTYVGNATPGLYPILKASEYAGKHARTPVADPLLVPAEYPYTRVAFKLRRELVLEAADFASVSKNAASAPREPDEVADALKRGLEGETFVLPNGVALAGQTVNVIAVLDGEHIGVRFGLSAAAHSKWSRLEPEEQREIIRILHEWIRRVDDGPLDPKQLDAIVGHEGRIRIQIQKRSTGGSVA